MIEFSRLETLLDRFPALSIGLVGDLFLDRYLEIDPSLNERSVETGLEAYQVTRVRNSPGAMGTVINNLAALGVGRLVPVTLLGDDGQAYDLLQCLAALSEKKGTGTGGRPEPVPIFSQTLVVDTSHIIRDATRLTPTYTKPLKLDEAGRQRELNRLDLRNNGPPSDSAVAQLCEHVTQVFHECDGLIVTDQVNEEGWGVVGSMVREHLRSLANASPEKLVFVDSRANIGRFRSGVLKPNVAECLAALGQKKDPGQSETREVAHAAAVALCRLTGCPLFCTLAERGMLVVGFERDRQSPSVDVVEGYPVEGPIDPVGAGDSATAGIVASLLAGASPHEAATVGNLVASITVAQLGTTGAATPQQVRDRWRQRHGAVNM